MSDDFVVKEAPDRANFPSGMNRGSQKGKPNYNLIDLDFLTRLANHLVKGAEIYGRDNWRKANSQEELERFRDSAFRHLVQYLKGETDEDHMAAVCFNLMAAEHTKAKCDESFAPKERVQSLINRAKQCVDEYMAKENQREGVTRRNC